MIQRSEIDNIVAGILKIILSGICNLFKRVFTDDLEGGKWKNVRLDDKMRDDLVSVPKHNKFSETIFGHLDRMLREKPNISLIASEAYIMFSHNRKLRNKSDEEKLVLLNDARKNAKVARAKFKERMQEIERRRKLILEEKMKKAEGVEKSKLKELQNYTDELLAWGLWQSDDQLNFHLGILKSDSQKIKASKAQLNFRKYVFQQLQNLNLNFGG